VARIKGHIADDVRRTVHTALRVFRFDTKAFRGWLSTSLSSVRNVKPSLRLRYPASIHTPELGGVLVDPDDRVLTGVLVGFAHSIEIDSPLRDPVHVPLRERSDAGGEPWWPSYDDLVCATPQFTVGLNNAHSRVRAGDGALLITLRAAERACVTASPAGDGDSEPTDLWPTWHVFSTNGECHGPMKPFMIFADRRGRHPTPSDGTPTDGHNGRCDNGGATREDPLSRFVDLPCEIQEQIVEWLVRRIMPSRDAPCLADLVGWMSLHAPLAHQWHTFRIVGQRVFRERASAYTAVKQIGKDLPVWGKDLARFHRSHFALDLATRHGSDLGPGPKIWTWKPNARPVVALTAAWNTRPCQPAQQRDTTPVTLARAWLQAVSHALDLSHGGDDESSDAEDSSNDDDCRGKRDHLEKDPQPTFAFAMICFTKP